MTSIKYKTWVLNFLIIFLLEGGGVPRFLLYFVRWGAGGGGGGGIIFCWKE